MTRAVEARSILVVDDDPSMRAALTETLSRLGHPVITASGGKEALERCVDSSIAAVLTDMRMPGLSGIDLYREVRTLKPQMPVILMSAYGTIEIAVDAMKSGVFDYLVKPFSPEALETSVTRALQQQPPASPSARQRATGERAIITQDPTMLRLLKMVEVVAASEATILIEGESGTGKELLARFVHARSPRAHRPFIAVNCAAVPEALLESELFGYEKGAFTGATTRKPGRFELAQGGTLLLDEVSEMHLQLQAKLLRVLQERELEPLGGREPVVLDIRVLATTNRPLWEEVNAGRFREDLYYRLNVFPLRIPPLRQRPTDVQFLAEHFMREGAARNRKAVLNISTEALALLSAHEWRGNVRELENVIERAVLLTEDGIVRPQVLLFEAASGKPRAQAAEPRKTVWEAERDLILQTLDQVGGNRTQAAKILGISIRTLRNKLREYRGLESAEQSDSDPVGKNCPGPAESATQEESDLSLRD